MVREQKVRKDEDIGCEWGREGPVETLERRVGLAPQGLQMLKSEVMVKYRLW